MSPSSALVVTGVICEGLTPSAMAATAASRLGKLRPRTSITSASWRMTPSWSGSVLKNPNQLAPAAMGESGARRPGYFLIQLCFTGWAPSPPPWMA